ncbi:AbiV family abortive infection protein [Paenarthrobacter nitroguajacolicus]|uniref:AbiV family abortive infection protein n=1 Tax=Paenarthrobacter nitroguajacolicus TaxID=211146 RepID=UPI0015BF1574|nr:AbiV family abortive infection protein [Paenarthrobacter nitroguajacolicus]NWL12194.1 AbiV family abortive infection protein [Paenarthrobacter nitroguajacolicus]
MELSTKNARELWKALMDNAASMVRDAELLLRSGSLGRARSLTVLAQEELGKALWIYDAFQASWSAGEDHIQVVNAVKEHGRNHTKKYMEAIVFGRELSFFWGDYEQDDEYGDDQESWERIRQERQQKAELAAKEANFLKQRGFYVDQGTDGSITSPAGMEEENLVEDLQTAAQVIEMLLIKDHTRMKHDSAEPYDGTHETQFKLLPIAHPEDWAAASEGFRSSAKGESHNQR